MHAHGRQLSPPWGRGGSGVIARGEMLSVDELKFKYNQNSPPGKYHSRAKVEKDVVLMT